MADSITIQNVHITVDELRTRLDGIVSSYGLAQLVGRKLAEKYYAGATINIQNTWTAYDFENKRVGVKVVAVVTKGRMTKFLQYHILDSDVRGVKELLA